MIREQNKVKRFFDFYEQLFMDSYQITKRGKYGTCELTEEPCMSTVRTYIIHESFVKN